MINRSNKGTDRSCEDQTDQQLELLLPSQNNPSSRGPVASPNYTKGKCRKGKERNNSELGKGYTAHDLTFLWLEKWSQRCEHIIDDELGFSIRIITSFTTRGIESGTTEELEFLQVFIRRKCRETRLRDRWHSIWVWRRPWLVLAASAVQAAAKHADAPPRVTLATEAAEAEEGLLFLALWT